MSFIRTDRPVGDPPDALDRALAMANEPLCDLPPNARAGPAGSLIRHVSAVAQAGGAIDACAAAVFVRALTSRVPDDQMEDIRTRVGRRTAEIVGLTHDARRDGPQLPQRLRRRLERIHREDDPDARMVIEQAAVREAGLLARSHKGLEPASVAELASAVRVVAESTVVDQSVAESLAELLASADLPSDALSSQPQSIRLEADDPRILPVGHCVSDEHRPYLTWHRDFGALAEALIDGIEEALSGTELVERREKLRLIAEAQRIGQLADADARSEIARLSPMTSEWIGTFEELRSGEDEFARDVRAWYWDDEARDDAIPDRLVDDFIRAIRHYGAL